jgi:CspA family cold shock protein
MSKEDVVREEQSELTGTVKRYNSKNGFGFIEADDGGVDLFVHQSEIKTDGFRCLEEGAKVKFVYVLREGKATATKVDGIDGPLKLFKSRLEAVTQATVLQKPGYEVGSCKWFNVGKGFGFIRKDGDTEEDVDIFVHVKDCEGMVPLRETQKVFFTIETEDSGRLRARDVTTPGGPLRPPAAMGGPMHPAVGGPAYFPPQGQYFPPQPQQNLPTHPPMKTPGTHVGTIKFYNTTKGFGFIITGLGTEMYVGKSSLLDQNWIPNVNDTCEYTEETNGEKVWAMNVRKTDQPVTRKRPMVQHQAPLPYKQARTDMYQDSVHSQYAPPQPAYNPAGQYQPPQYQPQYGAPQGAPVSAPPPVQYPPYDNQQPQYQQPPPAQYDYSRPAY